MQEKIIWQSKPSLLLYWPRFLFQPLIAIAWIFLPKDLLGFEFFSGVKFIHIVFVLSILIVFPLVVIALKLICTKYELSEERFVFYTGVLTRRREVIELYRVKDFNVISPFYLRIFALSNILLYSSDKTAPFYKIAAIKDGFKTEDLIRENVEKMRKIKGVREFD